MSRTTRSCTAQLFVDKAHNASTDVQDPNDIHQARKANVAASKSDRVRRLSRTLKAKKPEISKESKTKIGNRKKFIPVGAGRSGSRSRGDCAHNRDSDAPNQSTGSEKRNDLMELRRGRLSSPLLTHFLKVYSSQMHYDLTLFGAVSALIEGFEDVPSGNAVNVFYPGSDKHITPALFFKSVLFLDFNAKMAPYFTDTAILDWVTVNKRIDGEPSVRFIVKNFTAKALGIPIGSIDLLISQSAGNVSTPCKKYVRPNGYGLIGDSHSDAKMAFTDPDFELIGYFDDSLGAMRFVTDPAELDRCFRVVKTGLKLSLAQAKLASSQPRTKWGFKMEREWLWYIFRKL